MKVALTSTATVGNPFPPECVIKVYENMPERVWIPNFGSHGETLPEILDVHNPSLGWISNDYYMIEYVPFVPDTGKEITGTISYYAANNKLYEVYSQTDIIITPEQINTERDRRVSLGINVTMIANNEVIPVQTRNQQDLINISGLSTTAIALKLQGVNTTITFRDANDVNHVLTLDQIIELGLKTSIGCQAIYAKSWIIKAMHPIPFNYTDDSYWS